MDTRSARAGEMARPRILVIAPHASYRTAPFLAAAQALGGDVLVASQGEHSIVSALASGVHIDLADPEAALEKILKEARARPFAAVIGTDDAVIELAVRVAEALNLPHNPPAAVRLARRKDLARARLSARGVRVPRHWRIDLAAPLAPQAHALSYPCVLKPIAMSASRGVIRADTPDECVRACARIARIVAGEESADERGYLLAEEFIPGFEIAVEGMLDGGRLEVLAIFDKPDPLDGPYFEETYYITPSRLNAAVQSAVHAAVLDACRAYGLGTGPIHAECRINDAGVWILEVAARTIGGLCARLLEFGTGRTLEELVVARALGRSFPVRVEAGGEARRTTEGAGVLMLPIARAGILRRVEGVEAARRVAYIEDVVIYVREGYELVPLPEGASYLGFIYARAPTAALAEAALREAHARLNVVVAPLWRMALSIRHVSVN